MSITAGQIFKKILQFDNEETGEPIGIDLIADMDLRLYTERSRQIVKLIVGSGITKTGDGQFTLEIPETDTIKLNDYADDNAYLEGYLLPCKEPILIELGKVLKNKAND